MKSEMKSDSNRRTPYQAPRLKVYGNLREITLAAGGTQGMNDGGGGNDKTGF